MPPEIKYAQLLQLCKQMDYKGKLLDTAAMLTFVAGQAFAPNFEGKNLTENEVKGMHVVMPEIIMKVLDDDEVEEEEKEEGIKNAAIVQATIKALGLLDTNIPAGQVGDGRVNVKVLGDVREIQYARDAKRGKKFFGDYETAKAASNWLSAQAHGLVLHMQDRPKSELCAKALFEWCDRIGAKEQDLARGLEYDTKAFTTANTPQVIPTGFMPDIIKNIDESGVARQVSNIVPMTTNSLTRVKREGGMTGGYAEEDNAQADSEASYSNFELKARTFIVNATASRQQLDDAGVDMAGEIFSEMTVTITENEDRIWTNGTGLSSDGFVTGILTHFSAIGDAGRNVTGGGTALLHTETDLSRVMGRLKQRFRRDSIWICSPEMASVIFDRLGAATGGSSAQDIAGWGYVQTYRNRPIILMETMPTTSDASGDRIDVLFANPARGVDFGDRMGIELSVDMSVGFKEHSVAFKGVVRHDIHFHSIGTGVADAQEAFIALWQD